MAWRLHPGALLADFRETFGCSPGALPRDEAIQLLHQVVIDPYSRSCAALTGWPMRLGVWLQLRTVAALSGTADDLTPPAAEPATPRPTRSEVAQARTLLAANTAIQPRGGTT